MPGRGQMEIESMLNQVHWLKVIILLRPPYTAQIPETFQVPETSVS